MFTVSKEMSFDSAHRLVNGYQGKCRNNHGHTWVVIATCSGETLNEMGMLRDFGDFKPLKQFIDDCLDHATIVSEKDESFIDWLKINDQKMFIVEDNPTSEFLAKFLFHFAKDNLNMKDLTSICVYETCTSAATYAED